MKAVKIIALNDRAEETLRKQLKERLSFHQKMTLKTFFKTSYDGERVYTLALKSPKLVGLVQLSDLSDRIIKEFIADGCKKSDFRIEEVDL